MNNVGVGRRASIRMDVDEWWAAGGRRHWAWEEFPIPELVDFKFVEQAQSLMTYDGYEFITEDEVGKAKWSESSGNIKTKIKDIENMLGSRDDDGSTFSETLQEKNIEVNVVKCQLELVEGIGRKSGDCIEVVQSLMLKMQYTKRRKEVANGNMLEIERLMWKRKLRCWKRYVKIGMRQFKVWKSKMRKWARRFRRQSNRSTALWWDKKFFRAWR